MKKDKATAKFNMSFNNGSFKANKTYFYKYIKDKVSVITEEQKAQNFYPEEFECLFVFDK